MKTLIKRLVPVQYTDRLLSRPYRRLRYYLLYFNWRKRLRHFGLAHQCPVCGACLKRFLPFGVQSRSNALCPVCGALNRHRALWTLLSRSNLFDGRPRRLLHFSPRWSLAQRLRQVPDLDYVTLDLEKSSVDLNGDICALPFADQAFDVLICSHVLEHIPDDRRAIAELARLLRPDGWALLAVPISGEQTVEDPSVTAPAQREQLFGQRDHVRRYGMDVLYRLYDYFDVEVLTPLEMVGGLSDLSKYAADGGPVFVCRVPGGAARGEKA